MNKVEGPVASASVAKREASALPVGAACAEDSGASSHMGSLPDSWLHGPLLCVEFSFHCSHSTDLYLSYLFSLWICCGNSRVIPEGCSATHALLPSQPL